MVLTISLTPSSPFSTLTWSQERISTISSLYSLGTSIGSVISSLVCNSLVALELRPLGSVCILVTDLASGRGFNTTNELQSGEEKTLSLDVTLEQREEKSMPILQGLTPDLAGEKMKAEMPSTPDRTGKNPRPLATEVTNIYPVTSGRKFDTTNKLQDKEEITLPIDVPKEYREDIVEMRSWLEVSVENGLEGVKEIVSTIQHYFEQVPQARPWLWQSLGTTMQQTIRNALAVGDAFSAT